MKHTKIYHITARFLLAATLLAVSWTSAKAAETVAAYAVLSDNNTVLTFYYDDQINSRGGMSVQDLGWLQMSSSVTSVQFDRTFASYSPESTSYWFSEMSQLQALDLSNLNMASVTNTDGMFMNSSRLTTIIVNDTWPAAESAMTPDGSSGVSGADMFNGCRSLVGGAGTTYDAQHIDYSYAHIDGGVDNPGYFTAKSTSVAEPYAVLDGTTLYFYYDDQKSSRGGMDINNSYISEGSVSPYGTAEVAIIDASFANYQPISTAYWFQKCSSLISIANIENLKTDAVTSMRSMFRGCSSLTSLDMRDFKTFVITDMSGMFYDCSSLTDLDLSSLNTRSVTDIRYMFFGCSGLTSLGLGGFNTENVSEMLSVFEGCSSLTSLDLSSFNTQGVTSMTSMFRGCSNLTTIYVGSEWTVANVSESTDMFSGCTKLKGGAGTNFDASYIDKTYAHIDGGTSAPGYFTDKNTSDGWVTNGNFEGNDYSCFVYKLNGEETEIAVTAQDVVTDSEDATNHCLKVTTSPYPQNSWDCQFFVKFNKAIPKGETIHISLRAKASDAVNIAYEQQEEPFVYITTEGTLDLSTTWNTYQLEITSQSDSFKTLAFHLNGYEKEHVDFYFDDITITLDSKVEPYAVLTDNGSVVTDGEGTTLSGKTLTFYYDDQKAVRGGMEVKPFQIGTYNGVWGVNSGWSEHCKAITTVEFDESFANCTTLTSTDYWFYSFSNLTTVRNIENLKTPNVTTMECMFGYCSSLTSLDLSSLNTDNVTSLYGMFLECTSLKTLDLSGFNTSKVTNMNQLFYPCSSLKTIYVGSGWSTEAVTEGNYIFNGCTSLVGGAGTRYDSNHVDKTYARIDGGTSAPGYFTVKTTTTTPEPYAVLSNNNTVLTFYYDDQKSARGGMDIGPFAYLEHGFGESQRAWHDVRESIVYAVIDPSMSQYTSLVSTGWWFYGCKNLKSVSGWENLYPLNIVDMWGTFEDCSSLPSDPAAGGPDFSNFYSNSLKRTVAMFHGCTSMTSLDLSALNTSNVTENEGMFEGCTALTTIYVGSGWDMSNATDNWVDNMFSGCTSLVGGAGTRYDANNIGTSYAHIDGGIDNPGYLTELIRKPLTAADYFEWTGMKANATKKSESPYPNCYYILGQSAEIPYGEPDVNPYTYADVSMYDRLEVTATGNTPRILLNRDSVGGQWNEDESLSHMIESTQRGWSSKYFSHSGNVWTVDLKQMVADKGFAHLNAIKGDNWSAVTITKMELVKGLVENTSAEPYAVLSENNTVLTFFYDEKKAANNGMSVGPFSHYTDREWDNVASKITNVIFDSSFANATTLTSTAYWFWNCNKLESIEGIQNLNTANITTMQCMFTNCSSLSSLDVRNFNTDKVTNMGQMFSGCSALTNLDLSNFNTSLVYNFWSMFFECSGLKNLDLRNFNTSNLEYINMMFYGCSGLTSLDISNFNTEKVTGMFGMFNGCSNLVNLDMSNFKTNNVQDMHDLFAGCSSLASIQAGNAAIPDSIYAQIGNPNLLLYVNEASLAPASVTNVVVDGAAENIVLTDVEQGNNNFYCPQEFTARRISYTHNYRQATQVGVSRGWETIVLPFTVQTITHEKNGLLAPFGVDGGKPFWLRQLTENGLVSAQQIEANMPYLISMPNNGRYPADYNQAGNVTFSATNVVVPMTEQREMSGNNRMLIPTTMRVAQSPSVYAINRNAPYENNPEGSIFVADYREVRPFEAYVEHTNGARFISLDDLSEGDVTNIQAIHDIASADVVKVYNLSGVLLKTGKRQEVMSQLPKGIYIVNGVKVVVK